MLRQTTGRKEEEVTLVSSAGPEKLDASKWLHLNRAHWGVEAMHNRLDVSQNDDRSRIQSSRGIRIIGAFRRLSNSLFMAWRSQQPVPHPEVLTTTDFQAALSEEHRRRAVRLALAKRPTFKPAS